MPEIIFPKIMAIELGRTTVETQVYDIVIIDIVNLNAVVIICLFGHFVGGRVHLYVPMIMIISIDDYRIALDKSVLI